MVGKPSGKKGNTHAPGLVAPIKLGLAQLIEPDAVDQRLQALRYERGIHMGVSPLFLDQVAQPLELSQAFVIDLPFALQMTGLKSVSTMAANCFSGCGSALWSAARQWARCSSARYLKVSTSRSSLLLK